MRPEDEYRLSQSKSPKPFADFSSDDPSSKSTYFQSRRRSGCLTVWLALYVISAVVGVVLLLPLLPRLSQIISPLLVFLLFADVVVEGVAAFHILQWKRSGVQLLIGTMLLSLVLQALMRVSISTSIFSVLFSLGMLWFFVRPHWDDYE